MIKLLKSIWSKKTVTKKLEPHKYKNPLMRNELAMFHYP